MNLVKIKLALGRTREYPAGDVRHGYEFIAPLDAKGHLDAAAWKTQKELCTVRSFRPGRKDRFGHLRHVRGGWRFDYEPVAPGDDKPFFNLDRHLIAQGLYVTITEENGEQLPFRIVAMTQFRKAA